MAVSTSLKKNYWSVVILDIRPALDLYPMKEVPDWREEVTIPRVTAALASKVMTMTAMKQGGLVWQFTNDAWGVFNDKNIYQRTWLEELGSPQFYDELREGLRNIHQEVTFLANKTDATVSIEPIIKESYPESPFSFFDPTELSEQERQALCAEVFANNSKVRGAISISFKSARTATLFEHRKSEILDKAIQLLGYEVVSNLPSSGLLDPRKKAVKQ